MTKNPLDIIERASDILRALKKGVLVNAPLRDTLRQHSLHTICMEAV